MLQCIAVGPVVKLYQRTVDDFTSRGGFQLLSCELGIGYKCCGWMQLHVVEIFSSTSCFHPRTLSSLGRIISRSIHVADLNLKPMPDVHVQLLIGCGRREKTLVLVRLTEPKFKPHAYM
jgi:hypothetical protein